MIVILGQDIKSSCCILVFQVRYFAARMDWCPKSYKESNHPPVPALAHEQILEAGEGENVSLKSEGSTDPDPD